MENYLSKDGVELDSPLPPIVLFLLLRGIVILFILFYFSIPLLAEVIRHLFILPQVYMIQAGSSFFLITRRVGK